MSPWLIPAEIANEPAFVGDDHVGLPTALVVISGEWFAYLPIITPFLPILRANDS